MEERPAASPPFCPYTAAADLRLAETHRLASGLTRQSASAAQSCPCCLNACGGGALGCLDSMAAVSRASPTLGFVPRAWLLGC